jgi:hypothetical protein
MIKTAKEYRKATQEEIENGSPEMILVNEYQYEQEFKMEVAMWKLKAVLSSMGLLSQVDAALNGLPEPTKTTALLAWEYSPTVSSWSNTTKFVQGVLSLTDEQVEQIFTTAESISLEDQQSQNRGHKSSINIPVSDEKGNVKIETTILKTKISWFKRFVIWLKRIFKIKK